MRYRREYSDEWRRSSRDKVTWSESRAHSTPKNTSKQFASQRYSSIHKRLGKKVDYKNDDDEMLEDILPMHDVKPEAFETNPFRTRHVSESLTSQVSDDREFPKVTVKIEVPSSNQSYYNRNTIKRNYNDEIENDNFKIGHKKLKLNDDDLGNFPSLFFCELTKYFCDNYIFSSRRR